MAVQMLEASFERFTVNDDHDDPSNAFTYHKPKVGFSRMSI